MKPILYLRALVSALFPPKRRILRLVRPAWHTRDWILLECGHRVMVVGYTEATQSHARCDRCIR